jgi:16S rRNA pseudouridine516 synthase
MTKKTLGKIRLDRLLANLGYGSRKDVAWLIKQDLVRNHDVILTDPSALISLEEANLFIDDEPLDPLPPLTILVNKPLGYSCSHDEIGAIIFDLLPTRYRNRSPLLSVAGRLDKDSSGAVLLTDDGELLHRIISPKHHVLKRYEVTLADPLSGSETTHFMSGTVCLKDDPKPLKPALWQATSETSGVMFLSEGRYHQIRRMFGSIGNRVLSLHRSKIGNLALNSPLGDLPEGEYKYLDQSDIQSLFEKETP